jgi:hypothetical protein
LLQKYYNSSGGGVRLMQGCRYSTMPANFCSLLTRLIGTNAA